MASGAIAALGTHFQIGDGGGTETFVTVAEVTELKGPNMKADTIDVTSHDSTNGWKEFIAGLITAGEVDLALNFIPSNATQSYAAGLIKDMYNRTLRNFKLIFPDSGHTTWSLAGRVIEFQPDANPAKQLVATCKIQITGVPTLA